MYMPSMPNIAIQHFLLPGRDLDERFANAARFGFDGIELAVSWGADLEKLVWCAEYASRQSGVAVSSFCTSGVHDPLHHDPLERTRRFGMLSELIAAADALGAAGVVSVPVRPGLGAHDGADPFAAIPMLTEEAVDAFGAWAATLPASGSAALFLEPLNRYEARFLTRVGQAVEIARRVDSPRIKVLGDVFHMNMEEDDPAIALRDAGVLLGHVHVADNTRLLPGTGNLDFSRVFGSLQGIGYTGWLALECYPPAGRMLVQNPDIEIPASVAFLREQWTCAMDRDEQAV